MLQVIYNSHYNNGVPAMCADYFYLKLRCKHCQNPCCHNGVVDHLGPYPEYPKIFKMYPNISKSNQADLNVSECISKYPHTKLTFWSNTYIFPIRLYPKYQNVSKCFKTYPNISEHTQMYQTFNMYPMAILFRFIRYCMLVGSRKSNLWPKVALR